MSKLAKSSFLVILLFAVVVLVLSETGVLGSRSVDNSNSNSTTNNSSAQTDTQEGLKKMIDALEKNLEQNPGDVEQRLALADSYYDLGSATQNSAPDEADTYFIKAVDNYREVVKFKTDINVLVDMATAALYGGDYETSEITFKKALEVNPDFFQAHYNYGIFLYHAKNDLAGSLREWEKALELKPEGPEAERLKSLIEGLKAQISASNSDAKSKPKAGEDKN